MDTVERGYVVVDGARGDDATAQRDSWSRPFATLSEAFKTIQDNDTVLIYPGVYTETPAEPLDILDLPGGGAPLWLRQRRCVALQGIGFPEIHFTAHGNGLAIEDCTDIRIEGLKFRGAGLITEPKLYYFALLFCHGVNEALVVRDCVFTESGDHGIGHLLGPRTTNNCVIENNRFYLGGHMKHPVLWRDGAAIALGGSGNVIYGNRIERWLRGMEFESGDYPGHDTPTSRNIFSHNKVLQCWWQHILVTPTHRQADLFDQILIEGNIVQGWGARPEQSFDPASTFAHEGIYFAGGVNAQIRGNDISDMWDGIGVRMTADWSDIADVLVSENRIWNVGRTGIHAQGRPAGIIYTIPRLRATREEDGAIKIAVSGTRGQTVCIQRADGLEQPWTDWRRLVLTVQGGELTDPDAAFAGQHFYRVLLETDGPSFNVKRCRFIKNKIGPCGGRGIWLNGDYNVVESNDVHLCQDTQLWEGLYVQAGWRNMLRRNRLIDCLPLLDQGAGTQAVDNDHFWETRDSTE
jgi:hypothetical protein